MTAPANPWWPHVDERADGSVTSISSTPSPKASARKARLTPAGASQPNLRRWSSCQCDRARAC